MLNKILQLNLKIKIIVSSLFEKKKQLL